MIFQKKSKTPVVVPKNHQVHRNWKQKFRMDLYKRNYQSLTLSDQHSSRCCNLELYNKAAEQLITDMRSNAHKYSQEQITDKVTHLFCVFVPLKKNVQLDDQIVNTFTYAKNLKQSNNYSECDSFYYQIRKFMDTCKKKDKVLEGWRVCLKRFIVIIDILRRIQIFVQIMKHGTQNLKIFHEIFSPKTLPEIFWERIVVTNKYFQRESRVNKAWKISLQMNDRINEANISKTMKMLYCSICLIYDCGKHRLEDLSYKKDHHYCSPKNSIPKPMQISRSIQLLKQLRDLELGDNRNCNSCSKQCFRNLTKQTYENAEMKKSRTVSPMIESIIKMGIQMFSYNPCQIWSLFPKNMPNISKVTCSTIFLYLIEQINLQTRLTLKLNVSEAEFLRRQCSQYSSKMKPLRRRRKPKHLQKQQTRCQQTALCIHSYIGQQTFDHQCHQCACFQRGFCLPECQCGSNCTLMLVGCLCKGKDDCQTAKCNCYQNKMQCIPGICHNCFPGKNCHKRNMCINDQILRGCSQRIKIKQSQIPGAGFGAYADNKIKKGSLISIYCGEIVDQQMGNIRQTIKKDQSFYNFACSEGSIDARFMGNKTRFINHGNQGEQKTNLISLNMFSCGQEFIGLYALRDINQGEQLLFDYDVEGEVAKTHSDTYCFLKKNKIQSNE